MIRRRYFLSILALTQTLITPTIYARSNLSTGDSSYQDGMNHEKKVDLTNLEITDSQFEALLGDGGLYSRAKKLDLSRSKFNHSLLARLPQTVVELDLQGINITKEEIEILVERLPRLEHLNLAYNQVNSQGVQVIVQNLSELKSLNLAGSYVGDSSVKLISRFLRNLEALDLSNTLILKAGFREIADYLKNLEYLDLSGNRMGEEEAEYLTARLNNIRVLRLYGCSLFAKGADAVARNASKMPYLESLDVSKNHINDAGVYSFIRNSTSFKHLRYLNLDFNTFQSTAREELLQAFPNTKVEAIAVPWEFG